MTEAQPCAEGQTDEPIGREVADHGSAGITGAAQSAGGNGLYAVEELKCGTRGEESDGAADDHFIGGVEASDIAGKDKQDEAHGAHEGSAEKDGGVAGIAGALKIAATDGLTDADGGGGGESEGNHVGEGDGVESDLVASLSDGSQARDECGNESKDGDFSGELKRSGEAEGDEFANAGEVGLHGSAEQFSFVARIVPEQIDDEHECEISARNTRGDARAGYTVSGKAEFAEDEDIITDKIDEVGTDQGEGDRADHIHTLEGAADREVEKKRKKSGGKRAHVGSGQNRDGMGDAEGLEIVGKNPDRDGQKRCDGKAQVDAVDERAVAVFAVAGAESLRDERVESDKDTFPEESEHDEKAGRDANGSDGLGGIREPADHHGVDNDHAHPADFGENERESEAKGRAEFAPKDGEKGHEENDPADGLQVTGRARR